MVLPNAHRSHITGRQKGQLRKIEVTLYLLLSFTRTADHAINVGKLTIEMLPDEILLGIFAFYVCEDYDKYRWETLVHVCRRWRSIVFAAPCRLNLQLVCTSGTPVKLKLNIWPALPISIQVYGRFYELNHNVLAALENHDRIREVHVNDMSDREIEILAGAMQIAFPALTDLYIHSLDDAMSLSESFLGGSAPNLRSLQLMNVAFPALPKLLLSSPGLVGLSLCDIPHSGYISSEAIVDSLSSLTRLEYLQIELPSSRPPPDLTSQRRPPLTPILFPVLGTLFLKGVAEYLNQILDHMEAPHLNYVSIEFFDLPIFDVARISPWVGRAETFEAFDQAYMFFQSFDFKVVFSSRKGRTGGKVLLLSLRWKSSGWKLMELTMDSWDPSSDPFDLCGLKGFLPPGWTMVMGNTLWLHLVRIFTVTEHIYLTRQLASFVAPALLELTGRGVTEVLPILRNIFVERLDSSGPVQEALGKFAAARQLLSGHPVDVQPWVKEKGDQHIRTSATCFRPSVFRGHPGTYSP